MQKWSFTLQLLNPKPEFIRNSEKRMQDGPYILQVYEVKVTIWLIHLTQQKDVGDLETLLDCSKSIRKHHLLLFLQYTFSMQLNPLKMLLYMNDRGDFRHLLLGDR